MACSDGPKPWAYVTRKGKQFGGVISPTLPKTDVGKFLANHVSKGYEIVTVFSRAEYLKVMESLDV